MDLLADTMYDLSAYPSSIIESLKKQAQRYAKQIHDLEIAGMMEDRLRIRKAWRAFVDQQNDPNLWWFARSEYTRIYLDSL